MKRDHRPFIVTGSGRCGTGYAAQLLSALGYHCGHEVAFDWQTIAANTWSIPFALRGCDSSWLAMPLIARLPQDAVVLHQVRNPLKVVRSLMGISFMSEENRRSDPYTRIADAVVVCPADELEACMHFWTQWNRRIGEETEGRTSMRYRLEELDHSTVRSMLELIEPDRIVSEDELQAAFDAVPTNYNARPRASEISWNSIPPSAQRDMLATAAEEYGYAEQELKLA